MPIRITGMNSGLDTEALVSELVSAYRKKSEKYTKAQTKLSWKQEAWKELNKKITSFYSNVSSLKYSSAYNIKSVTSSDSTKVGVSASSSAVNGTYTVEVKQTAKSGYLTGANLGSDISGNSKLSDLGITSDGTISLGIGNNTTAITVSSDMTVNSFVSALKDAGVKANYDEAHHRIFVASEKSGAEADFSLSGIDANGVNALKKLGLSVASSATEQNYKDWAAYALNEDGTAYITGYDADGNAITNGVYSETKTKEKMEQLISQVHSAAATVTNNTGKIAYAKAYKSVQERYASLSSDEQEQLAKLTKESTLDSMYVDADGKLYKQTADGSYVNPSDSDDRLPANQSGMVKAEDRLLELQKKAGLTKQEEVKKPDGTKEMKDVADADKVSEYKQSLSTVESYESNQTDNAATIQTVKDAYTSGTIDDQISAWQTEIDAARQIQKDNPKLQNASLDKEKAVAFITGAAQVLDGTISVGYSSDATRINGQDAIIEVNGAKYTGTTNKFNINGLTIDAYGITNSEVAVTISNDTQGLYDKIKGVIKEYNTLINEMTKSLNADSSKGYEPLTKDEKEAMTDTEIEEWEKKIKNSILRRDDTLSSLVYNMTSTMQKSYAINGKNYSWASFGVHTLGVLYSEDNEENAFHIDGDSEDVLVSGNADKLMQALNEDPDTVVEFLKKSATEMYDMLNKKMKSTTLSSFNVVYNDKQMAKEYSNYTTTIKKWEDKLEKIEESYYKKFAAMEKALSTLNSQQSSLSSMLGM